MLHRAKKSLGQNFLKSSLALKKIVEAGEIQKTDTIIEIGPGKGALTAELLKTGAKIIAVEKDDDLLEFLREKFANEVKSGSLVLVHDDILEFDVESRNIKNYKVIANIPYNITGAIFKKFLTAKYQPTSMVVMVQHEVAKRIVARPAGGRAGNKESILSISVKAYGEPKMVMKVPSRYFSPAPAVDSAVIAITGISLEKFTKNQVNEEKFWEIVKKGFAHKRKQLAGNLKGYVSDEILTTFGQKRAEDLTLKDWMDISRA